MQKLFVLVMVLLLGFAGSLDAGGRRGGSGRGRSSSRVSGSGSSKSSVSVRGYTKKNGTYVAPSKRSRADGTQRNNYSTKGNVNPYTGKRGTRNAKR